MAIQNLIKIKFASEKKHRFFYNIFTCLRANAWVSLLRRNPLYALSFYQGFLIEVCIFSPLW